MKNYYYLYWADSIINYRKHHPNDGKWKRKILVMNSLLHSLVVWTLVIWLKYLNIFLVPILKINILPGHVLNSSANYFIEFILPFILINYFLIFYKNRYKKIVDKYKISVNKYALIINLAVTIISYVTVIISAIFWDVWK